MEKYLEFTYIKSQMKTLVFFFSHPKNVCWFSYTFESFDSPRNYFTLSKVSMNY